MPYSPEWLASYRAAHNGLSPAGVYWRQRHNIPLARPPKPGFWKSRAERQSMGQPGACLIRHGTGRPERCQECMIYADDLYDKCLDFASKNRWDRGWVICSMSA
jgi:hypothetical protein